MIKGISLAVDYFIVTADEAKERLASLKDEFNQNTAKLSELEEKFESSRKLISELQSKGTLSFTDQEELENLQRQNAELQRSIDLIKTQQELKQREMNSTFVESMHKDLNWLEFTDGGVMSESSYIDLQFAEYQKLQTMLAERQSQHKIDLDEANANGKSDDEIASIDQWYNTAEQQIQSQMDSILGYLLSKSGEFSAAMEGIFYIPNPTTETEKRVNAYLDIIHDYQDRLAIAAGGENAKTNAINRLITQTFAEETKALRELGEQGAVTAEHLNDEKYDAFLAKLIELGVITGETEADLAYVALAFNNLGIAASDAAGYIPSTIDLSGYSGFSSTVDSATKSLSALADVQDQVNKGFAMSVEKVMELAKAYPGILQNATVTANGQVKLNKDVVKSLIASKRDEVNASIDAQIEELEARKIGLEGEMHAAEAQLELAKSVGEGKGKISKEYAEYMLNANNALTSALIDLGIQEAEANAMATAAMSGNQEEFGRVVRGVFGNVQQNTIDSMWASARAVYTNTGSMRRSFASVARQAHEMAKAIAAAASGEIDGAETDVGGGDDADRITGVSLELYSGNFEGSTYNYQERNISLDDFISDLELDISSYKEAIEQIDGQIAVLEALKEAPLSDFLDDDDKSSTSTKKVEEYTAVIEKHSEALQKLEDAQRRRLALEKQLDHTEDLSKKIELSGELVDAYRAEAEAERELMEARKGTIQTNLDTLRDLGFEIEYNPETNRLYVKNMEHLNDLVAKSKGKYDTLDEATNALRKDTERLINTIKQLNDDNVQSSENIEDLTYSVLEAKNNIVDYIEEIYEKQIDAYQKIIDERKKLIESAKDELDYEDQIAEKVEEIADLQARIDKLSLDDSRATQAEVNTLKEELRQKQEELNDMQSEHSSDAQIDALDKMAEDYEAAKNSEIETLRSTVDMSSEIWNAFYQTLQGQTVDLGSLIGSEISDAWMSAANAVREYQNAVDGASSVVGVDVDTIPKYHTGGVVGSASSNQKEVLAVLQDGEVVLDDKKQNVLQRIIGMQEKLSSVLFGSVDGANFYTSGMGRPALASSSLGAITNNNQSMVFEPHIEVSIKHNGAFSDTDANAFGTKIANATIDSLYSAFERRGVISTRGSRLKP